MTFPEAGSRVAELISERDPQTSAVDAYMAAACVLRGALFYGVLPAAVSAGRRPVFPSS
jgi:hypothetical protein